MFVKTKTEPRTVGLVVDLVEGARVGEGLLGVALGLVLGLRLGLTVGRVVGVVLGLTEGRVVAFAIGRVVGRCVGTTVGLYVFVGPLVLGRLVGCDEIDGAVVGLLLGWSEGALDGCEDG